MSYRKKAKAQDIRDAYDVVVSYLQQYELPTVPAVALAYADTLQKCIDGEAIALDELQAAHKARLALGRWCDKQPYTYPPSEEYELVLDTYALGLLMRAQEYFISGSHPFYARDNALYAINLVGHAKARREKDVLLRAEAQQHAMER
jgi:hypothetical protein